MVNKECISVKNVNSIAKRLKFFLSFTIINIKKTDSFKFIYTTLFYVIWAQYA
jgi:hypothetical protein